MPFFSTQPEKILDMNFIGTYLRCESMEGVLRWVLLLLWLEIVSTGILNACC